MLFMISYSFAPHDRDMVQERFKKTGGVPGSGATMVGRWHAVGGCGGFVLAETSDSVALARWMQEWTDVLDFDITPVNNDEDAMKVLGA